MAVGLEGGPTMEPTIPKVLFQTASRTYNLNDYAVTADGQQFLIIVPPAASAIDGGLKGALPRVVR